MQFYKDVENNSKVKLNSFLISKQKIKKFWIIRISIISFCLSFFMSAFAETFLAKSNLILSIVILLLFISLNVLSDMLGLAITSCQLEELKNSSYSKDIKNMSLKLIHNSDKVSSILCDVIGDACGIFCGISSSIITLILSKKIKISALNVMLSTIISSVIIGLTVLFKAIAKNIAVKKSLKIVSKTSEIIIKVKKILFRKK